MLHNENCPVEATLELIGGKYKALILWRLSEGKLRFSQLRDQIKGVTPKMLTQQLRELEAKMLIDRQVFPVVPPRVEYSLTDLGKSLMPLLIAMRDWGTTYLRSKDQEPDCFMVDHTPLPQTN
ncbi:MAG: helix-turn-helix transcriptional regulator [Oscillospiraceae bacterium]|nr:helix-turn-helix transcriptional regulator [Oscillospiraceae bacterium]